MLFLFSVQSFRETELWVSRIVLLGRWSWESCLSVTLGKLLHRFTVQVSLETESLSRYFYFEDGFEMDIH